MLGGSHKSSPQIPSKQANRFHFRASIIGRKQPYFQSHDEETIGLSYIIQCELNIPLELRELDEGVVDVWRIEKTQN